MKKLALFALLIISALQLIGCNAGDAPSPSAPPKANANRNAGKGD